MLDSPPNGFVQYYLDCAASIVGQHHLRCSDVAWTRSNSSIPTYQQIYLCSRRFYQQLFWNRKKNRRNYSMSTTHQFLDYIQTKKCVYSGFQSWNWDAVINWVLSIEECFLLNMIFIHVQYSRTAIISFTFWNYDLSAQRLTLPMQPN